MSAHALLEATPKPTRAQVEEGLAGNYCRCAGYGQIIEAVLLTAERQVEANNAGDETPDLPDLPDLPDQASTPDAQVAPQ
jgi:carbon-monoxide dehydrogenase small subunit